MKVFNTLKTIIVMMVLVFLASCASSSHIHKNKKLKPGKPIPCPLKDC